jgi:hypothetical protein
MDAIPEGYKIRESINGIVSLAKERPCYILEEEVAAVKATIERHPKSRNYRVDVKPKRIDIYELVGSDMEDELLGMLDKTFPPGALATIREYREDTGQYSAVMRFTLEDEARRLFHAERMCYRSSVDGWLLLWNVGDAPIESLARRLIPALGTDAFFELH